MIQPLAPKTRELYLRTLARAFALDLKAAISERRSGHLPLVAPEDVTPSRLTHQIDAWPESQRHILRAVLSRLAREQAIDVAASLKRLPARYEVKRLPQLPTEEMVRKYESAAPRLPAGRRALALLPLSLGMRAAELLSLERLRVVAATKDPYTLRLVRKGGFEQDLPAEHAKLHLEELLAVPALGKPGGARQTQWRHVGEILSASGDSELEYQAFHALVGRVANLAGHPGEIRPHSLRHAFATRLAARGAPLTTIQWLLGHRQVTTTLRYVHPTAEAARAFLT